MGRLRVEVEFLTPAFLGGADPRGVPELRASSLRGALRFWLRALLGAGLDWGNQQKALEALRDREARVFGSTDLGGSPVWVRVRSPGFNPTGYGEILDNPRYRHIRAGLSYLLFPARPESKRGTPERKALPARGTFTLELAPRPFVEGEEAFHQACGALWLLTRLGGVGLRSRRGMGAVQATAVDGWPSNLPPLEVRARTPQELAEEVGEGLRKLARLMGVYPWRASFTNVAPYDVLHPKVCKIWVGAQAEQDPMALLARFAQHLKEVRRMYRQGEARAILGLPMVTPRGTVQGEKHDRRASPLLVRPIRLAGGGFVLALTLFWGKFLPPGEQVAWKKNGRTQPIGHLKKTSLEAVQRLCQGLHQDKELGPLHPVSL